MSKIRTLRHCDLESEPFDLRMKVAA